MKAMAMLTDGLEPPEGSGLDLVVGDIRDRSSLTPSLFKVSVEKKTKAVLIKSE